MPVESATYSQPCSMKPDQANRVYQMIASHSEFSRIGISINLDRETYDQFIARQIPKEEVLVIFRIPDEGVCMPIFHAELSKALIQESTVSSQREREK